jgi:hypothetical protein
MMGDALLDIVRALCRAIRRLLADYGSDPRYSKETSRLLGLYDVLQRFIREAERVH